MQGKEVSERKPMEKVYIGIGVLIYSLPPGGGGLG